MVEEKQAHKLEALGKKRVTLDQALTGWCRQSLRLLTISCSVANGPHCSTADLENTLEVSDRSLACLQDSDLVLMSKPIWRKIQVHSHKI